MADLYQFMGEHPVVTVLLAWSIASVFKMPFWAINRYFRSKNIRAPDGRLPQWMLTETL